MKKEPTIKRNRRLPTKELNEMEASKLSDIEFKRMVIRILKVLSDNYKELSWSYNSMKKEIETISKNQEEMKDKISEIKKKNTLEGIISRLDEAEDRISELEDKEGRNIQVEPAAQKKTQKI